LQGKGNWLQRQQQGNCVGSIEEKKSSTTARRRINLTSMVKDNEDLLVA